MTAATTEVDPVTGEVGRPPTAPRPTDVAATTDGTTTDADLRRRPTELSAEPPGDGRAFGWLAALELLALILVPGLLLGRAAYDVGERTR